MERAKKGYDFPSPTGRVNNVIHGNGPCNKERLETRIKATKMGSG